jgi:polar amino acid transport system permease protein
VEIIRSGIRSLDKGQFEACKSLNLTKYLAIKDIYIPQIVHNIFPALINEFIALIKESSLISVIGGYEIMKNTNIVIAQYYDYFTPLLVAGMT